MIENTTYSPFGEILSGGSVSRFDSEDKEFDSVVGDYDFNFRKMNPAWAMFTQPDFVLKKPLELFPKPKTINTKIYSSTE